VTAELDPLSRLPKFEGRDTSQEKRSSLLRWTIAGSIVGAFIGGVPAAITAMSRSDDLRLILTEARWPTLPYGSGGGLVAFVVGALIDDFAMRKR
jgi:hypothetical protein